MCFARKLSQMLETLRLNLVDLPEGTVDEQAMKTIAKPFAQGIINQYAPFHWRAYHSGPVSWFVWFVLAAILVIAFWMTYTGLCRIIVNKACIEGNTAGTQTSPRVGRSRFNFWERLLRGDAGLSGQEPMNFRLTDRIQVPPYWTRWDGINPIGRRPWWLFHFDTPSPPGSIGKTQRSRDYREKLACVKIL